MGGQRAKIIEVTIAFLDANDKMVKILSENATGEDKVKLEKLLLKFEDSRKRLEEALLK